MDILKLEFFFFSFADTRVSNVSHESIIAIYEHFNSNFMKLKILQRTLNEINFICITN